MEAPEIWSSSPTPGTVLKADVGIDRELKCMLQNIKARFMTSNVRETSRGETIHDIRLNKLEDLKGTKDPSGER